MPDPVKKGKHETEIERIERETCLACPLPDCLPHAAACGLRKRPKAKAKRKTKEPRPVPPGFAQIAEGMTVAECCRHYGVSHTTMTRWRKEAGLHVVCGPHRAKLDPPHNFLYYGRVESVRKLTERYGVSHHVISRWRKELGIEPETTWVFGKK